MEEAAHVCHVVVDTSAELFGSCRTSITRSDRDRLVQAERNEGLVGFLNILKHRGACRNTVRVSRRLRAR